MADVKGTRAALDQLVQSGALPPPGGGARPQVVAPSAAARNPSDAIDQLVQRGLLPPPGGGARQLPLVEQALGGTMGARPGPTTARAELAGTTRMGPTVNNAQALTILRRADQLLQEGASPDVVAEVRRVARETGDSLPLAAQTYVERAARISDDRGAALLAANPGLAKLVDRRGYADLAKDLEPLIVAEQAYAEANSGVERLGIILADTLVGRAVQRGSLQTAAGAPRLIAGANLGVALDIGATEEQILERLAAPYGGVDALQSYPPAVRTLILQTARDRYNAVQGMTEEDAVQALQTAAEYYFSAQNLVLQAEGLARNPGSQSFVENTLANAPNTVLGTLDAFAQDPVNGGLFLAETIFESAPQMLVTMLVSRGTGSLVAGATASGVAGLSREYVLSTTQFLAERGYTINSVDDAVAVLQNAELMQQAAEFGFARAVPIAVLDALAGALSGVQLGRTAIGDAAGQMLLQGAAGAGGETLAQIFSEGQVTNLQDITIEFLAELPTGLIEGPLVAGRSFGERRAAEQAFQDRLDAETRKLLSDQGLQTALDAATAAQDALETTRAAIEETATFARDPEAVRELLEAAGDQEVSIPVQEIERLYQEGALTDDDIAYLQVEDELTQQGDLSGDVSTTASRVLTLQGDAFARLSEHVRTQPGAPTTAEAREALANREADIERLQGVLEQAQAAADEVGVLSERIAAEVRAAAPQYTAAQGRAMGRLLAERYAARAALFDGVTATQLYERDRVTFEGPQAAPPAALPVAPTMEQVSTPIVETVQPGIDGTYRVTDGRLRAELNVAPREPYASSVQVPQGMQRRGIATALYDAAERDLGRRMFPSPLGLTEDAQQFWIDRLSRIPQDEALALLDEAQASGDARNVGRNTAERLAPIRESVLRRSPDDAGLIMYQDARPTSAAGEVTGVPMATRLSEAFRMAQERRYRTGRELKVDLQAASRAAQADAGIDLTTLDDENIDRLADFVVEDALEALQDNANAIGWYDRTITAALEEVAQLHPEILTDPARRLQFTWALAVTSNGLKVDKNFEVALQAYEGLLASDDQRFPAKVGIGTAAGQIDLGLAMYGRMLERFDGDHEALAKFMNAQVPVRDLERDFGVSISGEGKGELVRGASILGPKIGNGFFANLYGNFDALTMDRWLMRTVGRWRGTLININEEMIGQKRGEIRDLIAGLSQTERRALSQMLPSGTALKARMTQAELDALAVAVAKESAVPNWRTEINAMPGGESLRKLGNALAKYLDGQVEAPAGARERAFLREVFRRGLERLQQSPEVRQISNQELTMSDLQALLWYPEKRLYDTAKQTEGESRGYADDEAPDYANAARAVVRNRLGQTGRAGRAGGRPADGGRGVGTELEQPAVDVGRAGGYASGGLAPLEGAPRVDGASGPDARLVNVAEKYASDNGIDLRRQSEFVEVDPERAARIAQAYEDMPHAPQDPAVKEAYQNLIAQTVAQYEALAAAGYEFYFFDETNDPYDGNPWNAMRDLRANQRMGVFATEAGFGSGATDLNVEDNPMLADTGIEWPFGAPDGPPKRVLANDLFRAVHDAFGHGLEGAGFRARGEENAWQAHVRLFTGSAVAAITSETRGQNSWLNYGPYGEQNRTAAVEDTVFADQKTGLMPEWTWTEGRAGDAPTQDAALSPPSLEQPVEGPQTETKGAVGAPRGTYRLPTSSDPRNLITLSAQADPSTFVHEVGHMFLFELMRDLKDQRLTAEGRAQIEAQIAATKAWFTSNSAQAFNDLQSLAKSTRKRANADKGNERLQTRAARLDAAVERARQGGGAAYMRQVADAFLDPQGAGYDEAAEVVYHELWARGFEKYLGTGSAPSAELRSVFAKFVAYITSIYKSLRRLNVTVSPEVADVFDRLLATEDAINAERRGALYQVSPGVLEGATPAEANELRRLAAEAEDEARTQIARREQNALNQQERAKRSARREQLTLELTDQVAAEPVYTAVTILTTGSTPNGEAVFATGAIKLNRAEVVAQAGEALANAIPNRLISGRTPPTTSIDLGSLAAQSGFGSIDELLLALSDENLPSLSEAVRQRVDDQMDAEFGAETDPDALSDEAIDAAQNDKFQQLQQLQLRILRRLATQPMQRLAQRQAEQQGAPAAAADTAAAEAARAEQAAARTPREGVQAALARIRADVQRTANASQRRAQAAAGRTTRGIQRNVDPAAVEAAAERFVANLKVKDATPDRYRQAASRLTTKIERAIAARNYTEASSLMEQRALNLAVAKRAAAVQSKIEQQRTRWRDVTARSDKRLAQRYSIDWINAIRVMLEPFGMARSTPRNYDANKALAALASVEPTLLAEIQLTLATYGGRAQTARQAIPDAPYKDLGVQEALDMLETADTMLANARDSYGILVEGRRVEFAAISDEIAVNVGQRRKVQKQARAEARGRGTRAFRETRRQIGAFSASLRRIELWARDIDNGNPRGPMTRYLVRPVMRAVDAYTEARRGPQEALANLLRGRTDIMARKLIRATELDGYVFQSKGELLMALLHTGNPSNKRKLLLGGAEDVASGRKYVWGSLDADGNLDTTRWDQFTARLFADGTLTKADMDLVQGIWDIFEQTKKPAQAAHKQMYGYYFTEIEAEPLITPVGTYRGGYAPAVTDVMMNPDGERFEAEEVMSQQSNAAMFPGAEKGFTQSRTEYNQPLDLDLTRIPAHFDRVMKFAYLGPAVRQAARLVTSRNFRDAVRPASPDVIDVAVIPWLQRTVQQRVTTPPTSRGWSGVSRVAAAIDRRVGLHIMAGNIVNAAQQVTGFSVAAARIPARHLAAAGTRWRVDNQSARAYILSRSTFMQDRLTGGMNEASTTLENILSEPGLLNKAQNAAMRYGYFAQQMAQNLVDPTVWLAAERHGMETVYPAAYAEALERTGDEAAADATARAEVAEYADSVVRDTQAPLRPSDVSGIEASSPLARLFLKFYSYFNAMGNLLVTEKNIAMNSEMGWAGRYGRSFYAYLMIVTVPTIVAEGIAQLARGGFDDLDDEDERDQLMFELLIGSQLKTMAAMVPFAGAAASTAYGIAVTDQIYDDRISLSAGIGVTESTLQNVIRLIGAAADPDTDVETRRAIRTTLDALGLATGLPTGWAAKPISYAASVAEGDSDPEGLLDIVQGALTGRDGTE